MKKYKIAICEDSKAQGQHLNQMIEKSCIILSDSHCKFEIGANYYSFDTASKSTDFFNSNDIYFLDIQLSNNPQDKNGIELANLIRSRKKNAQIIFVTTHDELAIMTFERQIEALDYIVKNEDESIIQARITRSLEKARIKLNEVVKNKFFTYKVGANYYRINIDDIYYISTTSFPHRLKILSKNDIGEFTGNIKNIKNKNLNLLKISQSYLVNMNNISSINLKQRIIIFPTGEKVQFSFSSKRKIKQYLEQNKSSKAD